MFIACTELFKVGIGPSSSHTMGPMIAAYRFRENVCRFLDESLAQPIGPMNIQCTLHGSLAHTGKGHQTDQAILFGVHGYLPEQLVNLDVAALKADLLTRPYCVEQMTGSVGFLLNTDLFWNTTSEHLPHPNFMQFVLKREGDELLREEYVSIGGGFVRECRHLDIETVQLFPDESVAFPFASASAMLQMAQDSALSIAHMKRINELRRYKEQGEQNPEDRLSTDLQAIWYAMEQCVKSGLRKEGELPGQLHVSRRAKELYDGLIMSTEPIECHDWLGVYAMAVNEENADGCMVVTAPTNGAAGVIPACLYYFVHHILKTATRERKREAVETFLLTAAAIGGLIKHNSSISGAEVGCQGEVGSASAMAAAGLCAAKGGNVSQVEHAAEIALEHHLGMTCDPVAGLVQVPCIERNAFGAVKAWMAAGLAMRGSGRHVMSLDSCIKAMHETGLEMSSKYKETSLGGLATSWVEC